MSNKEKRNNVPLIMRNGMIPVIKHRIYDRKYSLWIGEIMPKTKEHIEAELPYLLFRRLDEHTEKKDIDKYIHEECKLMPDLFGMSVLLVPKENVFIQFGKKSTIIIPGPREKPRRPRQ